jgi:hypothetical protein
VKLHQFFEDKREPLYRQLADRLRGRFQEGKRFESDRVVASSGPWEIVLDEYTVHANNVYIPYTRLRAPFLNKDGLRFALAREGFFQRLGKRFGLQDIQIGDKAFDDRFLIKGNDECQIRRLFDDAEYRHLLMDLPDLELSIKNDEGLFSKKYPGGVDLLLVQRQEHIRDLQTLERFYAVFALTLKRLVHIDSAYESDPGLRL